MDVEAYISSGILELYVAGLLTEEENLEVYRYAQEYPRIKLEIEEIEASILALSKMASPKISRRKGFDDLKVRIGQRKDTTVVTLPKEKTNWSAYIGWAAAILFGAGLYYFYNESSELKTSLEVINEENVVLEQQIFEARNSAANSERLLNAIRDKDISIVPLTGQDAAPDSYAKVYWNKQEKKVLIDAMGLPEPPAGMVYQVWSLKLSPLTPTSLGLLEDFIADENKIFALDNANTSEAFGITLEPAGGSDSPTMEQLYTLGAVTAS
ncbi:MAG: anti-sigma factor [Eudoraea sp.]|nr:anti-sigma factor [Eudoraea sp.]